MQPEIESGGHRLYPNLEPAQPLRGSPIWAARWAPLAPACSARAAPSSLPRWKASLAVTT